ncbi:MAG: hypothetical protein K2K80_05680 [Clostridia bacterium]|nr:hypothetical protein [Clostridia bacterium]
MTRDQRKEIEKQFYRYKWNKREAENHTVTAVAYNSSAPDGERVKASSGNKNEQLIIRAIYETEKLRNWCKVFEYTLIKFKREQKDKLMQKRYLEHKSVVRICNELYIPESTYHYWHNQILLEAFEFAKEFKLL